MSETYATYRVWDGCKAPINLEYSGRLIGQIVREFTIDRDALLEEVKELEKCAYYFDLDFDEDEPLRDRLKEAAEDFAGCASRIREALGAQDA